MQIALLFFCTPGLVLTNNISVKKNAEFKMSSLDSFVF